MVLDGGGGGGGGGTYWYGLDIETMWTWVNRDLSAHYEQANSWKKTSELSGLYQSRLQTFRDKLAQSWNPDTSPAAQNYLTKLDELIKAVKDVNVVAGTNYQASVDIPNAISEAKYKLKPIYEAYRSAKTAYDTEDPTERSTSPNSPANRMNDKFFEAVSVMSTLGGDLSRSQSSLGKPAPYVPPGVKGSHESGGGDYGGGGGSVAPPVIPPIVPVPPPTPGPGPGPGSGTYTPFPQPKLEGAGPLTPIAPSPAPPFNPGGPGPIAPGNPGPINPMIPGTLPPGGLNQNPLNPNTPRPPGAVPPITGRLPSTTGIIGGAPPAGGKGLPSGIRPPNPPGGMINSPLAGNPGSRPLQGGPGGVRGVPGIPGAPGGPAGRGIPGAPGGPAGRGVTGTPGGVIGGRPGGGTGAAAAAGRPGQGVSAGGGGAGARGGAGAAGARGAMGGMGVAGARGANRDHDEHGEHYDPDTQWDVAHGVAPVVDAPEAQRPIDPGPAIGLSR